MPDTLDALALRAAVRPASLDRAARTFDVTASTGAPVQRRDARGAFLEVLDLGGADLSRLIGGPVLDAHRQGSRRDVLGVVEDARLEGGALVCRVRLSERAEVADVLADIEAGVLRGVSLGYSVAAWRDETGPDGTRRRVATRWTPVELSLVPVPADPLATIRSLTVEDTQTTTAPPPDNRAEANREIRSIAELAGLARDWADAQIDAGATPDAARRAAFDAMRTRSAAPLRTQTITVGTDHDAPQQRAERIGEALYLRINPHHTPSEAARPFVGMTLPEIGRDILRRNGVSTTGLAPAEVVTRALHTTSDFALILGDTVGRTLRDAYRVAPAGLKQVARQTSVRDFRPKRRLMLSEAALPEKVNEAGEFKSSTLTEAEEYYRADTFGRIFSLSRHAIVNDDLGAFAEMPRRLGRAAAEKEAQLLVDVLLQGSGLGPVMGDGKRLFHADHGNLSTNAYGPTEAAVNEARVAMRKQTGLEGRPISVTPRYLVVGPDDELGAEKLLATIAPARIEDANPFSGRLALVVEPRLAGTTAWYLVADPAEVDGLEYAYLDGAPGPQVESRNGFEVDGVEIKVRMDFGAGFVDWRGWYRNAGF